MATWTGSTTLIKEFVEYIQSRTQLHDEPIKSIEFSMCAPSVAVLHLVLSEKGPTESLAAEFNAYRGAAADASGTIRQHDLETHARDGGELVALTLLRSQGITLGHVAAALALVVAAGVTSIRTLSDRSAASASAIDVVARAHPADLTLLRQQAMAVERAASPSVPSSSGLNIVVQPHGVFRRHKRLVVFDMDSTLIQQEVIDEIARCVGVVDQVAAITEAAMRGELDFTQSLERRVNLLKGAPVSVLDTVRQSITFTPGVRLLCRALKRLGCKLAVLSGGFTPLAAYVKATLSLDYAFANHLETTADGLQLTGKTTGAIVDSVRKAELLAVIAHAEGVAKEQVIAVGDGANDLKMLAAAGLGIAFNAKPSVQAQAAARINQPSLLDMLYLLGLDHSEITALLQ